MDIVCTDDDGHDSAVLPSDRLDEPYPAPTQRMASEDLASLVRVVRDACMCHSAFLSEGVGIARGNLRAGDAAGVRAIAEAEQAARDLVTFAGMLTEQRMVALLAGDPSLREPVSGAGPGVRRLLEELLPVALAQYAEELEMVDELESLCAGTHADEDAGDANGVGRAGGDGPRDGYAGADRLLLAEACARLAAARGRLLDAHADGPPAADRTPLRLVPPAVSNARRA